MVIRYQITKKAYETKPAKDSTEWSKLEWDEVEGTIDDLFDHLRTNHFYRANFSTASNCGKKDFVSSQVVMLDYDKGEITMDEFVSTTTLKPTFYYMSHSSNSTGDRFRAGYVFDKPIYSPDEYRIIAKAIAEHNGVIDVADFDPASFSPYQLFCGAEYGLETSVYIYPLDKMKAKIIEDDPMAFGKIEKAYDKMPIERRELTNEEQKVKDDFYCARYNSFIYQYMNEPITCSQPISENEAFYFYDNNNYFEIIRKMEINENGRMSFYKKGIKGYEPLRFVDGERRRRKIAVSVSFIHQIKPNITLEELLAQTLYYINNYVDNTKDSISNHWIWNLVFDEYINPKKYKSKNKKKMRMKKEFFLQFAPDKHHNTQIKEYKKQYCLSYYDFEKTIEENVSYIDSILQEETNGVMSINKRTLMCYLKEKCLIEEKPITKIKEYDKQGLLTIDLLNSYRDKIDRKTYFRYKKKIK